MMVLKLGLPLYLSCMCGIRIPRICFDLGIKWSYVPRTTTSLMHAQQALPKSGKVIQQKVIRKAYKKNKKKTLASNYTTIYDTKKKPLLPGNGAKNLFNEIQITPSARLVSRCTWVSSIRNKNFLCYQNSGDMLNLTG